MTRNKKNLECFVSVLLEYFQSLFNNQKNLYIASN